MPRWSFTAAQTVTQWYGHVHLLPKHALGQWFCLDRATGARLWEHEFGPANSVMGVSDGVIVASETVSRGPGTWHERGWGIALSTGAVIWSISDPSDAPCLVDGSECVCSSGQVLDVRTGAPLRRISGEDRRAAERRWINPTSDADLLYRGRFGNRFRERLVRIPGVGRLTHRLEGEEAPREAFGLHAIDDEGRPVWSFDLAAQGYLMTHWNYYAYRFVASHVYVICSEGENFREAPPPRYRERLLTRFHLLAIDVRNGRCVQDVPLADRPIYNCRIEDADPDEILIGIDERRVQCHRIVRSGLERST